MNKPFVRETCYYRKLTDRGKDEPAPSFNESQIENPLGELTWISCLIIKPSLRCIALTANCFFFLSGNQGLIPTLKACAQPEASESGNLIVYNGAMVDIGSMMQKLERSERAREEIEQRLIAQDAQKGIIQIIFYVIVC